MLSALTAAKNRLSPGVRRPLAALATCLLMHCPFMPPLLAGEPEFDVGRTMATAREADRSGDRRRQLVAQPAMLGVYDPHDRFHASSEPRIEHVFVYWQAIDQSLLARKMALAERRSRILLVTVEPYTKAENWRDGGERLFRSIADGGFDPQIADVCGALARFDGEVWLRWGHEMEEPSGRYPWARSDPSGYVAAYRHFATACKRLVPRARFVWSPRGESGLAAYFPGEAHVDMIGLSVWGLEKWDRERHRRPRGFIETFDRKYRRVERYGKPVLIAELGVSGSDRYRQTWMSEISGVAARRDPFPLLAGMVFFNDAEPYHWPDGFGAPDWRIARAEFAALSRRAATPATKIAAAPAGRWSPPR